MVNCKVHAAALEAIVGHARAASPRECCGVLLGHPGEILEAIAAGNLAEDANRYLIDPKDHIDARRRARSLGVDLVGFYHSHPHSAPSPSAADLAEASYPGHLYLIVSVHHKQPDVRIFRLEHGRFDETPFITVS